ncbi:MAG: hypothetical protein U9N82_13235 [Thermodesulfobacteriota bacterium]|nr:hypothetical protein [Thermodesulfobacteriota bacterium]
MHKACFGIMAGSELEPEMTGDQLSYIPDNVAILSGLTPFSIFFMF